MGVFSSLVNLVYMVLMSPAVILFYAVWIASSLFRPLLVATILCCAANPAAAKKKIAIFITTFKFLALSKDKKWKKSTDDPASFFKDGDDKDVETKTVIFVRHGESTWNDTFNKGDRSMGTFLKGFIPGLIRSFGTEWYFFISGQCGESWFFDSPLSLKGISQAEGLRKFLKDTDSAFATPKEAAFLKLLKGETDEKCQLMSSNLRRAISTIAIGLGDRLDKRPEDKIMILTELQEVSFNPDALSIHPPNAPLVTSWMDSDRTKEIYREQCDTSKNKGNKPLESNGLMRLEAFCKIIFEEVDATSVVATGHSYWFRAFFQTYLPSTFDHVAKKKKLINGGCAGFTFKRKKVGNEYKYMIDPNSIQVLYGGF